MKLREKQMEQRRNRILDTAESLIRSTGSTDFSVRRLAADAEVSPTTPFNLFGSKEGILFTLLLRSLDMFREQEISKAELDANLGFIESSAAAAKTLVNDDAFFRPLYRVLMGVTHPIHRPMFMRQTFQYWLQVASTVPMRDNARDLKSVKLLAHSLMSHFTGLMEMWINTDLTNEEFVLHVQCAAIVDSSSFLPSEVEAKSEALLESLLTQVTFSD